MPTATPQSIDEIDQQVLADLLSELGQDLESMTPRVGVDRFLRMKRPEISITTVNEYEWKLNRFIEFSDNEQINDLSSLDGQTIDEYASWLRYDASDDVEQLSSNTMKDEMYLFREFIDYLESIDVVQADLSDKIRIPKVGRDEGSRDIEIKASRVNQILNYLSEFHYASIDHIVWLIQSHVPRRPAEITGLDLDDAHLVDGEAYLDFRHRPPATRLKNGFDGEGPVAISDPVAETISRFIESKRPQVEDDQGRKPLIPTSQGRMATSTYRRYFYRWSRPCIVGDGCPHSRDPDDCQAAGSYDKASKCPSSVPPYALRHGYISDARRNGVPIDVISDRCDASPKVILRNYDESTREERLRVRRKILGEYDNEITDDSYISM